MLGLPKVRGHTHIHSEILAQLKLSILTLWKLWEKPSTEMMSKIFLMFFSFFSIEFWKTIRRKGFDQQKTKGDREFYIQSWNQILRRQKFQKAKIFLELNRTILGFVGMKFYLSFKLFSHARKIILKVLRNTFRKGACEEFCSPRPCCSHVRLVTCGVFCFHS